jgi:hypothetical protein
LFILVLFHLAYLLTSLAVINDEFFEAEADCPGLPPINEINGKLKKEFEGVSN